MLAATLIPHVTHFDRADITDLDAIITRSLEGARAKGVTLTLTGTNSSGHTVTDHATTSGNGATPASDTTMSSTIAQFDGRFRKPISPHCAWCAEFWPRSLSAVSGKAVLERLSWMTGTSVAP